MSFQIPPEQPAFLKSVKDFALYSTLRRSLRSCPMFLCGGAEVLVLIAPPGIAPEAYQPVAKDLLFANTLRKRIRHEEIGYGFIKGDTFENNRSREGMMDKLSEKKRLLLFVEAEAHLSPEVRLAADAILQIGPVTPRDLKAALHVVLDQRVSIADAEQLLRHPLEWVWTALRPGRPVRQVIDRLEAVPAASTYAILQPSRETPPLSEMHGYGAAKKWGLQLARDLAAWRRGDVTWDEVDRGIVLYGPPGVGKTIFAKALAAECGIPLIATSLGQWQSAGHLGECLKKMRRSFAQAKEELSILFIDELDSLGDRSTFAKDHRDYSTQVVNAFLECLDGVEGREGVIVVGATNKISAIDPAILRSGRLDRSVEIPLPSAQDRIAILEQGLGTEFASSDRAAMVMQTARLSGADLMKAVRDAKRMARSEGRAVRASDVAKSLPALLPIAEDYRRRNALHEAGHTLVGLVLNRGEHVYTQVAAHVRADADTALGGQARFDFEAREWRDLDWYMDHLALLLGGIAAEKLVLGAIGDGAGGGADSDLAKATEAATLIEVHHGMGCTLRWSNATTREELELLRRHDAGLRRRIDRILKEQLDRAISILSERREMLDAFTEHLFKKGSLTAARAKEIIAECQSSRATKSQRRTGRHSARC